MSLSTTVISTLSRGCSSAACSGLQATPVQSRPGQSLPSRLPCLRSGPHCQCLWRRAVFHQVLPRIPTVDLSPRGSQVDVGLSTWLRLWHRACCGLQATPVLFGRTEPPGRLPSCARPSTSRSHRASLAFPTVTWFPPGHLTLRLPASREARLHGSLKCSVAACSVSMLPLSIRPWTVPPGRLHPCARTPNVTSRIPGPDRSFPAIAVPDRPSFPSRLPDSRGPICSRIAAVVLRPAGSAGYPYPFRPDRAPWPPSLLRQVLRFLSLPGWSSESTRYSDDCFPLTVPRAARSLLLDINSAEALRRAQVCTLPLNHSG